MFCTCLAENTGRKNDAKNRHLGTIPQLCRAISSQLRHVSTIGKKNLLRAISAPDVPHNMVNFGLLAAEIISGVWGTPVTFNGCRVFAALLHGSQVVSISQTLRCWTEGATYVWQGDHHVGHWSAFLVCFLHCITKWLHCVSKELSVTLSNRNQFSKCLHCWNANETTKPIWHYPPHFRHVATLP